MTLGKLVVSRTRRLPLEDRRSFYVRDDYPARLREAVEAIYTAPGFYRSLPPIAGAIESVKALLALGHDVRLCTSPTERLPSLCIGKIRVGGTPPW